jgi:hypothetical protein
MNSVTRDHDDFLRITERIAETDELLVTVAEELRVKREELNKAYRSGLAQFLRASRKRVFLHSEWKQRRIA